MLNVYVGVPELTMRYSNNCEKIYGRVDVTKDIYGFIKALQKKDITDNQKVLELLEYVDQLPPSPKDECKLLRNCKYDLPLISDDEEKKLNIPRMVKSRTYGDLQKLNLESHSAPLLRGKTTKL
jgi:hypothetical protein